MRSRQEDFFIKHYEDIEGDKDKRFKYEQDFKNKFGQIYFSGKSTAIYAILDNKDLGGKFAPSDQPVSPYYFANPNWF